MMVAPFARMRCSASMPAASAETRSVKLISRAVLSAHAVEHLRHVRDAEPPGHAHDPVVPFVRDSDPTFHGIDTNRKKWAYRRTSGKPTVGRESASLLIARQTTLQ